MAKDHIEQEAGDNTTQIGQVGRDVNIQNTLSVPKITRFTLPSILIIAIVLIAVVMVSGYNLRTLFEASNLAPVATNITTIPNVQTVRVLISDDSYGRGFFSRGDYIIADGWGLEKEGEELLVTWENDGETHQQLAIVEALRDNIILLRLNEATVSVSPVSIRNTLTLKPGDIVKRYIAPHDITLGRVIEVNARRKVCCKSGSQIEVYGPVTTVISSLGDGGAPVIDVEGKVIGLIYGDSRKETIVFPIQEIKRYFPQAF